ncbi:MAG: DUF2202 domain-containing protein [Saprospiraceae bacterium]|nr:DUF2202 domain-containing protein [Lewinella sp.]
MKNARFKPLSTLLMILAVAVAFTGCEKDDTIEFGPNGFNNGIESGIGTNGILRQDRLHIVDQDILQDQDRLKLQECKLQIDQLPVVPLTEAEITSVLYNREAQKVSRDLYLGFYDNWQLAVFENVANGEQAHMDAMLFLIDLYDLTDPVGNNEVGVFYNAELQERYNIAWETGLADETAALREAALIQEMEIAELDAALTDLVENDHLDLIYNNLVTASGAHLHAFVKYLQLFNIDYEPQVLSIEAFNAIMNENWTPGHHGGRK